MTMLEEIHINCRKKNWNPPWASLSFLTGMAVPPEPLAPNISPKKIWFIFPQISVHLIFRPRSAVPPKNFRQIFLLSSLILLLIMAIRARWSKSIAWVWYNDTMIQWYMYVYTLHTCRFSMDTVNKVANYERFVMAWFKNKEENHVCGLIVQTFWTWFLESWVDRSYSPFSNKYLIKSQSAMRRYRSHVCYWLTDWL